MTADAIGGVWTYALDLCRALQPHGVNVLLATMGDEPSAAQRAEAANIANVELATSRFKLEWMDEPWDDVAAAGRWLLDLAEQFQPDIVHLNGYAHGIEPFSVPFISVAHSCCLSWWEAVKGERAPASFDSYRRVVQAGLSAADVVVAPTRAMLASVAHYYGPLSTTTVILNGRDASLYQPAEKQPVVLSAGRMWDEAKNIATLARAAKGLDWPVRVAGPGGDAAGDAVQMLGRLSPAALARELSRASIYALPARYEPFGLSVLEAALSGCALVLGDIPSLREVWGDSAVFVPPDDAQSLHDAMQYLISHPAEREQRAVCAQQRAQRYSLRQMGQNYFELYRQQKSRMNIRRPAELQTPVQTH